MKKLLESLQIEGVELIGSDFGFDLYKILTWEGAQAFFVGNGEQKAGEGYVRTPELFNHYIANGNQSLFFFTKENSNRVLLACVDNSTSEVLYVSNRPYRITNINYRFQDFSGDSNIPAESDNEIFPLYLLPDLEYNGLKGLIFNEIQTTIIGNYEGLVNPNDYRSTVILPDNITRIVSHAFRNYPVRRVIIDNKIEWVDSSAFSDYEGIVEIPFESLDDAQSQINWSTSWTNVTDPRKIKWGYNSSNNDGREQEAQQEFDRMDAEKAAREAAERRRQEIRAANDLDVLRYKVEKDYVTILGCKRERQRLTIPEEIEGKPVKKIAPYAFYNDDILEVVILPKTIEEIGKAAFYNCNNATVEYPKSAKLFTDAFAGVYRRRSF